MTSVRQESVNRIARLAGGLYLSLAALSFFSFAYVPSAIVMRGDAAATSRNIMESELLFRAGAVSHLVSQVVVVFLVLALYRLLAPVNRSRAALMAVLALLAVPVSVVSEAHSFGVLHLLAGARDGVFSAAQVDAQVAVLLEMHRSGVLIAQIFWGLWALPLAALVFKSGFLPRLLAIPVAIAAAGYLIDSTTQLLFPGVGTVSQFTAGAEMLLPLWLLIRGVSTERWQLLVAG